MVIRNIKGCKKKLFSTTKKSKTFFMWIPVFGHGKLVLTWIPVLKTDFFLRGFILFSTESCFSRWSLETIVAFGLNGSGHNGCYYVAGAEGKLSPFYCPGGT